MVNTQKLRLSVLACIAGLCVFVCRAEAHDPEALWKIVNDQCVRHQLESGNPAPCAKVDLHPGAGFAVLKDINGVAQYLVIPTVKITGIESPELLSGNTSNYWGYAWQARTNLEDRLHRKLARDQVALTVNSAFGRTQNQLHIHIDCIRPDVRETLRRQADKIGGQWVPLDTKLNNHPYWAMRILGTELGEINPFKLLAEGMSFARNHMERQTLVLVGMTFNDGSNGFILLEDHADLGINDRASGEELLDHQCALF